MVKAIFPSGVAINQSGMYLEVVTVEFGRSASCRGLARDARAYLFLVMAYSSQ
jgi:hypothetical protein